MIELSLMWKKKRTIGDNLVNKFLLFIWNKITVEIIAKYTWEVKVFNQISATIVGATITKNDAIYLWLLFSKKLDFWNNMYNNNKILTLKAK